MLPPELITTAPHSPGVYLMLDARSVVLYVGKAKDLVKRLASYTRVERTSHSKTAAMLARVKKVDTIVTHTEKEALILEASLIKKHAPKYNIILRDDKNYPYIKVTVQEKWPRVMMSRKKARDKAKYFGPYSSSSAMWATLKLISALFPLRTCRGSDLKPRKRPCLNYQMGRCSAPCAIDADHASYMHNVSRVIMILEGKNKALIQELQQQMEKCAEALAFEEAAKLRDTIQALTKTFEKQVVAANHILDQDVFGYTRKDASVAIAILFIRSGIISGSRTFFLADPYGDDQAILSQILGQLYSHGPSIPKEIVLPFLPDDHDILTERLTELRQTKVHLLVPRRGDRSTLLQMAENNTLQLFKIQEKKKEGWHTLSQALTKKLRLTKTPDTIECLDISNLSGKQAVGSLVCFEKGEAAKKKYRHYKIKSIDTPNDYQMMAEVMERRFTRGIEEDNLPDLFMVDGGKGQLNIALKIAQQLGIADDMDWIGIAKEKQEEGEKLFKPGRKNPIILRAHDPVLLHLMRIRDESHRFGITFHRKLRRKNTLTSELDAIPGIGAQRKKQLLRSLGSLKNIKVASVDQLQQVPGVGSELAKLIHKTFQPPLS